MTLRAIRMSEAWVCNLLFDEKIRFAGNCMIMLCYFISQLEKLLVAFVVNALFLYIMQFIHKEVSLAPS